MSNRRGALVPGLFLVLAGVWLLARNLGVPMPGIDRLWPLVPLGLGLAFLVRFFQSGRQDEGLVFSGVAGALVGAFFLAITLGPLEWGDLGRYWPVFVLIGGAAFLAQWLVKPAERGLLIPAGIALAVGLVGLAITLNVASLALAEQVAQLWPVALILAGIGLLASYLLRADRRRE